MYKFTAEQNAEAKKQINELYEKYYGPNSEAAKKLIGETPTLNIKPLKRRGRPRKNPIVEVPVVKESPKIEVIAPIQTVVESPKVEKPIEKPVAPKKSGEVKISKLVQNLIGQTVNTVKVLSYNEAESLPGKPAVNCLCKCGKEFVSNAYHIQYGRRKDCGCEKK